MPFSITTQEILLAALLAFVLTWLITTIIKFVTISRSRMTVFNYPPKHFDDVLQRCCRMFPTEIVRFNGAIFRRGMQVIVTTVQQTRIEGEFVGVNDNNVVCFMTKQSVFAHELEDIQDIQQVDG